MLHKPNPHIVIAPDSFKGSMSAEEAAKAIARGIRHALPKARLSLVPIADGGEGTLDCMIAASGGNKIQVQVRGPLGDPIHAEFGVIPSITNPSETVNDDEPTAVIEMAKASGIGLVSEAQRDPCKASTYGTGQLIQAALEHGCRRFILALGGSATNDGGTGMLQALGARLFDETGKEIEAGGIQLGKIAHISIKDLDPRIQKSTFIIASDVQNPLVGPNGATRIFAPQKGATPEIVEKLEAGMQHWADIIQTTTGKHVHHVPGAGAAGGIAAAFIAFFPSEIQRGIDVVIEHSTFRHHLPEADLVITGEGRIDHQTASGKTPMGIAQEARKFGVPTIAIAGSIGDEGVHVLHEYGIHAVFSLINRPMSLETAIREAPLLLEHCAEQIIRLYMI